MELTQDKAHELFEYRDGALFWKHRTISRGRKLKKGGQQIVNKHGDGYYKVTVNYKTYLLHRVVWLMHYGDAPEFLDHINGIRTDNRIENLRPATKYENALNSKLRSDNTSGVKGVCWNKKKRKWFARIYVKNKHLSLGYYDDLQAASDVVKNARLTYHKEFANHGY
jgi:hypothetical protein